MERATPVAWLVLQLTTGSTDEAFPCAQVWGAFTENESMCGALEAAGLPPLLLVPLLDPPLPLLFPPLPPVPPFDPVPPLVVLPVEEPVLVPGASVVTDAGDLEIVVLEAAEPGELSALAASRPPEPQPVTIIAPKQIDAPTIALW